jgi:hypothetical protein
MRLTAAAVGYGPASGLAAESSPLPPLPKDEESEFTRDGATPGVAPAQEVPDEAVREVHR